MNRRAFLLASTSALVAAAAPGSKVVYPDWVLRGTPGVVVTAPADRRIRVTTSLGSVVVEPGQTVTFPYPVPGGWLTERAL